MDDAAIDDVFLLNEHVSVQIAHKAPVMYRTDDDETWHLVWESSVAMAIAVAHCARQNKGEIALEICCGCYALPSLALASSSSLNKVTASDLMDEAVLLVRNNAIANGLSILSSVSAWQQMDVIPNSVTLLLGADMMPYATNASEMALMLSRVLHQSNGVAIFADPGRNGSVISKWHLFFGESKEWCIAETRHCHVRVQKGMFALEDPYKCFFILVAPSSCRDAFDLLFSKFDSFCELHPPLAPVDPASYDIPSPPPSGVFE